MTDLVGCFGTFNNISNWLNDSENKQHLVITGPCGCGKSKLISDIQDKYASKVVFYTFDCSQKLNKKIITEKINTCTSNLNIIDALTSTHQDKVFIFDEIDGYIDTDNVSLTEVSKMLTELSIKAVFITTNKGITKLKEILPTARTCKLGNYNINDILKTCTKKYPKIEKTKLKECIKQYGDDIRSLMNTLDACTLTEKPRKARVSFTKDISQEEDTYLQRFCKIKKENFNQSLALIEQDTTNYMLLVHENYNILNPSCKQYEHVLENLYYIDLFNNRMFEHQQWYLNEYACSFLLNSIKSLEFEGVDNLKIGTLWSKYSNWQYKRKLYNNFTYLKSNCIFYNFDFVYGLKDYVMNILESGDKEAIQRCVQFLKSDPLYFNKEDFEQLLRITNNESDIFKGALKTKFLKELKN